MPPAMFLGMERDSRMTERPISTKVAAAIAPGRCSQTWGPRDRHAGATSILGARLWGCRSTRHCHATERLRLLAALWRLAERMGFEPTIQCYPYTRLAGERLRPLGHLSSAGDNGPARPDQVVSLASASPPQGLPPSTGWCEPAPASDKVMAPEGLGGLENGVGGWIVRQKTRRSAHPRGGPLPRAAAKQPGRPV
jgi:hypothetical protein